MELVELDTLRDALVGLPGVSVGGARMGVYEGVRKGVNDWFHVCERHAL